MVTEGVPGRVLALDPGTRRVGVAVSDELRLTAHGLESIPARPRVRLLEVLQDLVKEYNVTDMVIGLPIHMDSTEGRGAAEARALAQEASSICVRVHLRDERLTSMQAERVLLEADVSRKRRRHLRDRLAAVLILQGYLDSVRHEP